MLEISIPGGKDLRLEHLVLDYNGTLACDGEILPGVKDCLHELADRLQIYVLTADTFGKARAGLAGCPRRPFVYTAEGQETDRRPTWLLQKRRSSLTS